MQEKIIAPVLVYNADFFPSQRQLIFNALCKPCRHGTVVNAAARIEGAAHGGQIVASAAMYEQVSNKNASAAYTVATKPPGAPSDSCRTSKSPWRA